MEVNEKYQVIIQKKEFDYLMELKEKYHKKIKDVKENFKKEFISDDDKLYEVRVKDIIFKEPNLNDAFLSKSNFIVNMAYGYYVPDKYDDEYGYVTYFSRSHMEVYNELNELHDKNVRELQKAVKELNRYVEKYGVLKEETHSNDVDEKEKSSTKKNLIKRFINLIKR